MSAILAAAAFEATRYLARHEATFRREAEGLRPADFVPYPERELYDSGWLVCLVLLRWSDPQPWLSIERNQGRAPATAAAVAARADLLMAGFSRMQPGCHVVEHADRPKAGVLRWLLPLQDRGATTLSTPSGPRSLRAGAAFVFDHSLVHAAANDGRDACDFLVVDFEVSPAEARELVRSRGGVNLGPTAESRP